MTDASEQKVTNPLQPLDAVISGYAYESATTAISVIEEGKKTKKWISTEMLCTLDNFIKTVLFNERIFFTGVADLSNNRFLPRNPKSELSKQSQQLFDEAGIFHPEPQFKVNDAAVHQRVATVFGSLELEKHPLFIIECDFPKQKLTIFQEMVYLDIYFIEYAIEKFGAEHFKPVFPGEHLYLGLRSKRLQVPHATETMADMPGRRLRACIRNKMEGLNQFVTQGARLLPVVPPIFASGIMRQCQSSGDFVRNLLNIRDSATMKRLRHWMARYAEMSTSSDLAKREKAVVAFKKLKEFDPQDDLTVPEFVISLVRIIKSALQFELIDILSEVAAPTVKVFLGAPFRGLRGFGGKNISPEKFDAFLQRTFGDLFNRNEMDFISDLLRLPESLSEWEGAQASISLKGGRLAPSAPPLSRPCFMNSVYSPSIHNAEEDFKELFKKAERVTPEMLRDWEKKNK